jgi:Tol biopolymer transport system component
MTARTRVILGVFAAACVLAGVAVWWWQGSADLSSAAPVGRVAAIYPDYSGLVVPPNIAPLNFQVREPGNRFCAKVSGDFGQGETVFSSDGRIQWDAGRWRDLLAANRGRQIRIEIFARADQGWQKFETIVNRVAAEPIDGYVVYRMIPPIYNIWGEMSLVQRALDSFDEKTILSNRRSFDSSGKTLESACVNCHTFSQHDGRKMILHVRPGDGKTQGPAMILVDDGRAVKVETRNGDEPPAAYASWHPSGKLLAFSRNKLRQIFHSGGVEVRDVPDTDSDLALYLVDSGKVVTHPLISRPDRLETFPEWSPDGRTLYFCSAAMIWPERGGFSYEVNPKIRYDLMRVDFDLATGQFGRLETVVSAAVLGKSCSQPRISPDGRFLMFCGHDYGSFAVYQPSSDLYMIDLKSPRSTAPTSGPGTTTAASRSAAGNEIEPVRLSLNSDRCESYHSWSSNSRWVVFASKREDGVFARLYLSYVDSDGNTSKPFPMPQKDPSLYERQLMTYNRPELIDEPMRVTSGELVKAINSAGTRPVVTGATPKSAPDAMWRPKQPSLGPASQPIEAK